MSRIYFTNKDGKIEDLRSPFKFDPTSADKIKELVKKSMCYFRQLLSIVFYVLHVKNQVQGQLRKEDKPTKIKTLSNEFRIYDMGAKCWLDDDDNFAYAADCEHGLKFLLILAKDQEYPSINNLNEYIESEELTLISIMKGRLVLWKETSQKNWKNKVKISLFSKLLFEMSVNYDRIF